MTLFHNVFAQGAVPTDSIPNPLNITALSEVFNLIVNLILAIGWALVFVMLALGFVQYVTSRGEAKATDAARQWLTYAVVGGVGLFLVGAMRTILPQLLGGSGGPVEGVVY